MMKFFVTSTLLGRSYRCVRSGQFQPVAKSYRLNANCQHERI
jgi:hypothetical protein